MGCVLVDQVHAVGPLGDDVRVGYLAEDPQRPPGALQRRLGDGRRGRGLGQRRALDGRWQCERGAGDRCGDRGRWGEQATRLGDRRVSEQRLADGALHAREGIAVADEAHFALIGMHVRVDLGGRDIDEHRRDRVAALHQQARVGLLDGDAERAVGDPPAVDEEAHAGAVRPAALRRAHHAVDGIHATGRARDLDQRAGDLGAVDGGHDVAQHAVAGGLEQRAGLRAQSEANVRVCHGHVVEHAPDASGLGAGRADELQACRDRREERFDGDRGARRAGLRALVKHDAALQLDEGGRSGPRDAGDEAHVRGGGDAGQRLAAEAERRHGGEVVQRA